MAFRACLFAARAVFRACPLAIRAFDYAVVSDSSSGAFGSFFQSDFNLSAYIRTAFGLIVILLGSSSEKVIECAAASAASSKYFAEDVERILESSSLSAVGCSAPFLPA